MRADVEYQFKHKEHMISLQKFDEIAHRLGQIVNYDTREVVEASWYADCIGTWRLIMFINRLPDYIVVVNGVSRGKGSGRDEAIAKAIAARGAYQALGWTD